MSTPSSWFIPPGHIFSHWLALYHSFCDALPCFCWICCVFLSFLSLCVSLFHFYLPIFMFTVLFFFLIFLMKYSWITVLYSSVLYGKVTQFYIIFHILFHYHLSQDIKYISLCCTVGPCCLSLLYIMLPKTGFPGGSEGKASACNAGDLGSIPRSGRFPGEGNGNPV